MPHCVIEYSEELNKNGKILETIETVNQELINSKLFDNRTIKTRAIPILNYLVGGNKTHFIHTSIKLLEGRSDNEKKKLSENVLSVLSKEYELVKDISVEIIDINKKSYSKN